MECFSQHSFTSKADPIASVPKHAKVMSTCVSKCPFSVLKSSSTTSGTPPSAYIPAIAPCCMSLPMPVTVPWDQPRPAAIAKSIEIVTDTQTLSSRISASCKMPRVLSTFSRCLFLGLQTPMQRHGRLYENDSGTIWHQACSCWIPV